MEKLALNVILVIKTCKLILVISCMNILYEQLSSVCVCGEQVEKIYGTMKLNEAQLKNDRVHTGRFVSGDNQIVRMQFFS